MSHALKILPEGRVLKVASGKILSDVLEDAGLRLSFYCGRRGLCGKCIVEIVRGALPSASDEERSLLARRKLPANYRLACRARVEGDMAIRIPLESLLPHMPVLSHGVGRSLTLDPAVKKISLSAQKPDLASPDALLDFIQRRFPNVELHLSLETLRRFAQNQQLAPAAAEWTAVLYADKELLAIEPGDTTGRNFGIAVDLGTTTVIVELLDLNTGKSLDSTAGLNAQVKYGADVVSRITAAYADPSKLEDLRTAIVGDLNEMVGGLLRRNQVSSDSVYEAVVAGNTAMNHLLLGLPVTTLAVSPYQAVFSVLPALPAVESGLVISPLGRVYIAPNIKSFVGGDISAGLSAVDLEHQKGSFLFVDLGTNGEIVLKRRARFTATSTAAGPAFEGMTISCGMLALPGAVYKAGFKDRLVVETIAGEPARGVCGTGLIDIIAVALEKGFISAQGHILGPAKKIEVTNDLSLNQQDIREVQLAVAAVKTGIRILLAKNKMAVKDLDGIFVAGAFGNYLNIPHSMKLGLLPCIDRKKIFFVGNSSLAGAKALLLSRPERIRCERLANRVRHLSLAKDAEFQTMFIEALEFKAWNS